ncbi:MAG: ABC transporter ATP-binding protein [Acidimicrobiales bacterium]|nr:ABC transporter ATP-binding protein [Acidimicrobiales bacterium]MCB1015487.1 ABC transporter ATP-binding protein [Acidimicrobiales bacterium]MCB9372263.1 ABC transporter ATP-binding protein [Microthrixaceae bacterium]
MAAVVQTRALTKRYGRARGVEDLDLEVAPGTIFGFLGPNGAGKSTTIRTLLDFQRPTSGEARVFGLDSRRDSVAIHRRVGYLPGELTLYDRLTGREHVRLLAGPRRAASPAVVDALVERFGVELDRPVRDLSKGNRQKVGLVLAFMHEPELLVLDEPTSGLDPLMQDEFLRLLRETAAEGRTVLLSSHSLDEVQRVADRVSLIRDGRLVVTATIAELQAQVPRSVALSFESPVAPGEFAGLPGVTDVVADGDRALTLSVTGPVDPVVKAAARHTTVEITAQPADLETLFLRYYRGPDGGGGDGR